MSLAFLAKLSRLRYSWLRFGLASVGWCTQPANSQLIPQSSMKHLGLARLAKLSGAGVSCPNFLTKTPASDTVKGLPGYTVQNRPSGSFLSWGGTVGRGGIVYDLVWMGCPRRTPWTELRTMLVSYRRLSPLFQFSLSAVTLVYLSQRSLLSVRTFCFDKKVRGLASALCPVQYMYPVSN
jgi:hypothetical protein